MRRSLGMLLITVLSAAALMFGQPSAGQESRTPKSSATTATGKTSVDKTSTGKTNAVKNNTTEPSPKVTPAEKPAPNRPAAAAQRSAKGVPIFTPEREAAALAFVTQHHQELAGLLAHLKTSKPREYERAAQELFRTSERLALSQERDPERYQLELEMWKIDSKVRLLAARLMMADDPSKIDEMRELMSKREELQLQVLLLERENVAARAARLDTAIEKARQTRAQKVQASLDQVMRGINESRPKGKPQRANKPAIDSPKGAASESSK